MVNNKSKGKQQQPQPHPHPHHQASKKGSRNQSHVVVNVSKVAANPTRPKNKSTNSNKSSNETPKITQKSFEQNTDASNSINTSLKRLNISNKKASSNSKADSAPNSTATKPTSAVVMTAATPRTTSRDEDHKDDPMGHKKNQFGKMRLSEIVSNGSEQNVTNFTTFSQPCAKCSPQTNNLIGSFFFTGKQFRKHGTKYGKGSNNSYYRTEPRNIMMNSTFVPIVQPSKPVLSTSNIEAVIVDTDKLTILEKLGKGRTSYPIMQVCPIHRIFTEQK